MSSIRRITSSIKPFDHSRQKVEACAKIAGLSALLAAIIVSGVSLNRFFFPLKNQIALVPGSGLSGIQASAHGGILFPPVLEETRNQEALSPLAGESFWDQPLKHLKKLFKIDALEAAWSEYEFLFCYRNAKVSKNFTEVEKFIAKMEAKSALTSSLREVVTDGNLPIARLLIDRGADVNAADEADRSPIHIAIHKKSQELVQLLIESGADIEARDDKDYTPLLRAIEKSQESIVDLLIRNKANVQSKTGSLTPLHLALSRGQEQTCRSLISAGIAAGADLNAKNPDEMTPLVLAIRQGMESIVDLLIQNNVDVEIECEGFRPLDWAVTLKKEGMVRSLIAAKADVNLKNRYRGYTPLVFAILKGTRSILDVLIQNGANIQTECDGLSPLNWALSLKKLDMVRSLIAAGADPFRVDSKGDQSPYAQAKSDFPLFKILTGTENHPAFKQSYNQYDFFKVLYPLSDYGTLVGGEVPNLPDLSFLDEHIRKFKSRGITWGIPFVKIGTDPFESVSQALIRQNQLFAKAWYSVREKQEIKIILSSKEKDSMSVDTHENKITFHSPRNVEELSKKVCRAVVLAMHWDVLNEIFKKDKNEYIRGMIAILKKMDEWTPKLLSSDNCKEDSYLFWFFSFLKQWWPPSLQLGWEAAIDFQEDQWVRLHSESYLKNHRQEFKKRLKELLPT